MTAGQSVVLSVNDMIAELRLNRPDKYNALDQDMVAQLFACIGEIERAPSVRGGHRQRGRQGILRRR